MPAPDPALWARVRAVLEAIDEAGGLEAPGGAVGAGLEALCADADGVPDAALVAAVRAALEAERDAEAGGFLAGSAVDDAPRLVADGAPGAVGQRVGPWELTGLLGEGGMGVVYRARRADGAYEQEAALKLVGRGLAPPSVLGRFRRERQILAGLRHPNVARLLDGGVTAAGQPYFAMELVEGEPITAYADARGLGVEARVRLLRQVVEAVAYAHRRLVVHRDLKPSNVLVASGDEGPGARGPGHAAGGAPHASSPLPHAPRVKLLDFGIAKVLAGGEGAGLDGRGLEAPRTRTGTLLTPEYAAPEQVAGGEVTTATDVYALGVLLYELLAGRRPHGLDGLSPSGVERALEALPPPPSAAGGRRLGDLDAVCLKALAPEPDRRYASAAALGDDLDRYLAGLPVEARAPTARYRASRFVRRHPAGVAAAAAFLVLLGAFAVVSSVQARRLAAERDRAEREAATADEVAGLLTDLFVSADPYRAGAAPPTVREVLEDAPRLIAADLEDRPEVRGALLARIGQVFVHLGQYARADSVLRAAVATFDAAGLRSRDAVEARKSLAHATFYQGRHAEAARLYRATVVAFESDPDADPSAVPYTQRSLAMALSAQGLDAEAEAILREALPAARTALGPDHAHVGIFLTALAGALHNQGKAAEARATYREAAAFYDRVAPEGPDVGYTLAAFAAAEREAGSPAEAVRLYRAAVDRLAAHTAGGDPSVASFRVGLAGALLETGQAEEAAPLLRAAVADLEGLGADHSYVVAARAEVDRVEAALGRPVPGLRAALAAAEG